ncbi:hypothetical protein FQZ97_1111630 [compost metagenome]
MEENGWRQRTLPGFAGLVGPLWTKKEATSWAYGLLATDAHTNPAGLVHGGLIGTLLDHALSAIAWEAMERRPCVTVNLSTQFLAAGRSGQFLEARGRIVRSTSSLVFMQGEIRIGENEIATASAILKIAPKAPISQGSGCT